MNNDINDSGNIGNNGNRGKFTDRLKKIRRDRLLKKKNINNDDELFIKTSGRNLLKIFLALPSVVYTVIKPIHTKNIQKDNKKFDKKDILKKKRNEEIIKKVTFKENKYKVKQISDIDVTSINKNKDLNLKKINKNLVFDNDKIDLKEEDIVKQLQKEILNLIRKKLVKNLNELEILQSELYILKELDSEDIYFNECQNDIKEIKKLLSKIKSLKEKYDYLKNNVDFEYMLEYDDKFLIDKILELKELCNKDEIKFVVDNYKILEEYKSLYLKIDKLQENTIKYEEYKNKKASELKQRDIDFDKLKNDVYNIDGDKDYYVRFVKEQELLLKNLEERLLNIDSHEEITYRLKGFNKLLGNSFKYLGLLLVNPLKGLIPGIATQTVVTRNLIHNLYNNLEWEENRKIVYEAIDYSVTINSAIHNLENTSSLVDSTLEEVIALKNKYMSKFKKYENDVYGYKDAIKKINKMENAIVGTKIKLDLMKQRMLEKEKQNNNKIQMVKKLNSSNNN